MDRVEKQLNEAKADKRDRLFVLMMAGVAAVMGGHFVARYGGAGTALNPAQWFSSGLDGISTRTLAGQVCRDGLEKVLTAPGTFKIVEQSSRGYAGVSFIDIVFDVQNGFGATIRRKVSCSVGGSDNLSLLIRPLDWPASGLEQMDGRMNDDLLDLLDYDVRAKIAALPKAPVKAAAPKQHDPNWTKKVLTLPPE